jgi:hypothetical protein
VRNPSSAARILDLSSHVATRAGASPPFGGSAKKVRKFLEPLGQMDGFARNKQQGVGWGSAMPADNKQDYEQKIRRLRDLAAEVRLLAADMRHHQSRASLLQIAAAYDDLATILSRLASSPNWLTFSPPSPSTQPSATGKD